MRVRVPVSGLVLQPGVYWIEMQFTGSSPSGPWVPPVTEPGMFATGHAIQRVTTIWTTLDNSATGQAGVSLPFRVFGTTSAAAPLPEQVLFGVAKPATGDVPAWGLSSPVVGRAARFAIADGAPGAVPVVLLGTRLPGVAVPPFGILYVSPLAVLPLPVFDPLTRLSTQDLPMPHGPEVCGIELALQGVWVDPAVAGSLAHTGGMVVRLGSFDDLPLAKRLLEVDAGGTIKLNIGNLRAGARVSVSDPTIAGANLRQGGYTTSLEVQGLRPGQTIVTVHAGQDTLSFHVTVN